MGVQSRCWREKQRAVASEGGARQRCDMHARRLQSHATAPPSRAQPRHPVAQSQHPRSALRRAANSCRGPLVPPCLAPSMQAGTHLSHRPHAPPAQPLQLPIAASPCPALAHPPAAACAPIRRDSGRRGEEGRTARSTTHSTICSCLRRLRGPMQRRLRRKRRGPNRQGAAAADAHCKTGQYQRRKGRPLPARVVAGKVAR